MKKLLLLALLVLAPRVPIFASEHIADNCKPSDGTAAVSVQEAMTAATETGAIVTLPVCSETWTNATPSGPEVTWDAPCNAVLRGAGGTSVRGGDDDTTILDNITRTGNDAAAIQINLPADPACTFEMYGIKFGFSGGADQVSNAGHISISGSAGTRVKIHHVHFEYLYNTGMWIHGQTYGVLYENLWRVDGGFPIKSDMANYGGYSEGDGAWAADTSLGSANFIFLEDNTCQALDDVDDGGGLIDADHAGRFVVRYNELDGCDPLMHPLTNNRGRGTRAYEVYGNDASGGPDGKLVFFWISSGTGVIWGNNYGTNKWQYVMLLQAMRTKYGGTYSQYLGGTPGDWGFCGPPRATGTVDTSGTAVTHVSGTLFDTGWPVIADYSAIIINGTVYSINAVASTTSMTLTQSAGTQTGVTYVTGSNWDENLTDHGRRCMDQPGNGKGDLLTGSFPNVTNDATGGTASSSTAWPRQALEPLYEWNNTGTCVSCSGATYSLGAESGGVFEENYNFYRYTANFDGTVSCTGNPQCGVGSGARTSSRPSSTRNGLAWWATDAGGNWNTSAAGDNDGCLDIVQSGAWVNCVYTPYTYPHPLRDATESGSTTTGSGSRTRLRVR